MMKNNFWFLPFLALFATAYLVSCGPSDSDADDSTIYISGFIEGLGGTEISVSTFETLAEVETDPGGRFNLQFEYPEPAYFFIEAERMSWQLFLTPGDSIFIGFNKENFPQSFLASGDRYAENEYLVRDKKAIESSHNWDDWRTLFEAETDDYFASMERALERFGEEFDRLEESADLHPLFADLERAYPAYRSALLNAMYPRYHMHIQEIEDEDELDFPNERVNAELMELDHSDSRFLALPVFREALNSQMYRSFQENISEEVYDGDFAQVMDAELNEIKSFFENPEVADYMAFDYIRTMVVHRGPGPVNQFYDRFLEETNSERYAGILRKEMDKWEDLQPGLDVPDFAFEDIEGNEVRLSDLRGQLVYIDVWATWCGPCLREHPYWEELILEFEDEEVAFLGISIDNSKAPWLEMVPEKELSGHHWYAENAWKSDFATHFLVNSIPRFILLDHEGKILEPAAERPSGNIAKTLRNYLQSI